MLNVTRQRLARGRRVHNDLLQRLAHRHPERVLSRAREKLGQLAGRLAGAERFELNQRRRELATRAAQLNALSPLAVLGRGYAIALRDQLPVLSSQELTPGDQVRVRLAHGSFHARVTQVDVPREVAVAPDADEAAPHSEVRS